MPMPPLELFVAILALSAAATSFVSGIFGMAGGMILMGILLALTVLRPERPVDDRAPVRNDLAYSEH